MGKIIAIGGDDVEKGDFEKFGPQIRIKGIDKEIIRLTGKKNPLVLFIPTASSNSGKYIGEFERYFKKIGCKTDVLILDSKSKKSDFEEKILSSDAIYVGGGNTLKMMTLWRRLGVDKVLKRAFEKGIVLSGLSAGGICWFSYGHSDSRMFTSKKGESWPFIRVRGLGLFNFIFCPHYHFEKREKDFHQLIMRDGGIGLSVDNRAAIEIVDNDFKILKVNSRGKAYLIRKFKGKIVEKELENSEFEPLSSLVSTP